LDIVSNFDIRYSNFWFMHDLIIIGGGPAGMSAAIYAARAKQKSILITSEFGGQMARKEVEIENYPGLEKISALDLIARFRKHLDFFSVEVRMAEVFSLKKTDDVFEVAAGGEKLAARTVIVATGASPRLAGIPGENEFLGRGVCYCATCDGPLFARRDVAVVGGGNAAFEAALFLAGFSKKIYILERGPQVLADNANQKALQETGKAQIITNARILRLEGKNFVQKLVYRDANDADKKEIELPVEGVFVKAGNQPASDFLGGLVDLNERKEIKFDFASNQTKTPGLFVAGDVSEIKFKQIVVAAGEGAKAAMAAGEYLRSGK
jgi:thioredoxin-disulfide reductase